jgi:uncharacterized membrane protein YphA (DoxX/SURF4 family)
VVRILTSVFFLFFGEYKVVGDAAWTGGGFEHWVRGFLNDGTAVGFYAAFLEKFVLAHPLLCARIVGWGELFIGISLLVGLWVRAASVAGAVHMVSLTLATWYGPGRGAPAWRYLGSELDHLPLLLLFAIFFFGRAGETWGLDGWLARRRERAQKGRDERVLVQNDW